MGRSGKEFKKPILTDRKPKLYGELILPKEKEEKVNIALSFKYFYQQEHFGLGDQSAHWFISLLDRLKDITSKDLCIVR
jgi:hypothetical protein